MKNSGGSWLGCLGSFFVVALIVTSVSWLVDNIMLILIGISLLFLVICVIQYLRKKSQEADYNLAIAKEIFADVTTSLQKMTGRKSNLYNPTLFFNALNEFTFAFNELKTPALASTDPEMIHYVQSGDLETKAQKYVCDYIDLATDQFERTLKLSGYQDTIATTLNDYHIQLHVYEDQLSEQTKAHCNKKLENIQTLLLESKQEYEQKQEEARQLEAPQPPSHAAEERSFFDFLLHEPSLSYDGVKYRIETCDLMNGHEFEKFCMIILSENLFIPIQLLPNAERQGIDILAEKANVKYGIQCKRQSSGVGNKAVQEAFTGKTFHNCHVGVVLTNRHFTPSAKEVASKTGVLLWDRNTFQELIDAANKHFMDTVKDHSRSASNSQGMDKPVNKCAEDHIPPDEENNLYPDAVEIVVNTGMASVSMLQRRLNLDYSRAVRLMDQMEKAGIVGPFRGSKPREVFMTKEAWQAHKQNLTKSEDLPCQTKSEEIPV